MFCLIYRIQQNDVKIASTELSKHSKLFFITNICNKLISLLVSDKHGKKELDKISICSQNKKTLWCFVVLTDDLWFEGV